MFWWVGLFCFRRGNGSASDSGSDRAYRSSPLERFRLESDSDANNAKDARGFKLA